MQNYIRLILFIIIFLVFSIGITAGMIVYQNDLLQKSGESGDKMISGDIENISDNSEKEVFLEGIDLEGTYDENAIVFTKVDYEEGIVKGYYQQISGLKNKEVQEKINQKLKNSVFEGLNSKLETVEAEKVEIYQYVNANFANVISVSGNIAITLKEKNKDGWPVYENETFNLNLKLKDGEELEFEELFTTDADILEIVKDEIYEDLVWISKWEGLSENSWEQLVTEVDERELRNRLNQFITQKEKDFWFTPKMIIVSSEDSILSIDMEKCYEDIAIYNRFLEEESLYEDDTIGKKDIVTLAIYHNYGVVYEISGQKADNFFCEAKVINWDSPEMSGIVLEEERKELFKKLEAEYTEKLNAGVQNVQGNLQDEAVVLIESYQISNGDIINVFHQKEIYKMTQEYYEETFKGKIRSAYRNIGEGGGIDATIYIGISETEPVKVERISESLLHSAKDGRELTEIKDYFKEGYDYESVLKNKLNDFWHQKFGEYLSVEDLEEQYKQTRFINRYGGSSFMLLNETLGYEDKGTNFEWSSYIISLVEFDPMQLTI